jgi:hypothetical protein
MKVIYFIVYQGGIANVFSVNQKTGLRKLLVQNDFRTCETYCRGLKQGGCTVKRAWCNEAGDIRNRPWSVTHFENAPWNEKFSKDFE